MVSLCGNLALMIEQRVQHVERLARRRRNELGVEGAIAVREVSVSLEAGLVIVVGIQIGGGTTRPGSLEELAIRRRCHAAAKVRGKRFSLLLVDQAAQRKDVGLIAN